MASRVKEDERNERVIRGLLKLPANKRCINCNNLGPQYVCTNFSTFVCTNCSGAHREFTHRVKSISMAKFTSQEVTALQEGGNERAREIFFKEWDAQRNAYPDSSNADKLRNFIKHVYVERRYTGERSTERPPRGRDDKDEYSENRKSDGNWGGSRSPPNGSYSDRRSYSGRSDDRNSRYSYGDRSPGYDQNDFKKSPRYFEVVDDRSGKTTPVQRFEDRRSSEPRKPDTGSPNYQKEADASSPVVRPVRDILGDEAPQLRVGEPSKPVVEPPKPVIARPIDPPKPNGTRAIDPPPQAKTVNATNNIASPEGPSEQVKVASAVSLIDFSEEPESAASTAPSQQAPRPQQHPVSAPTSHPVNSASVSGGDWASFDAFGQQQTQQSGSSANPLESALAQLTFSETPYVPNSSANDGGQSTVVDQSQSLFGASFGISGNQASSVMSTQGTPVQQPSPVAPTPGFPSQMSVNSQGDSGIQGAASSTESKPSGRKELPADIFTALYQTAAPTMPGWQRAPQFGMGYTMQYPAGVFQGMQAYPQPQGAYPQPQGAYPHPQGAYPQSQGAYPQPQGAYPQPTFQQPVYPQQAYSQPVKASNPFDFGNEPGPVQGQMHPSGPLGPAPQTLIGTSSFGVPPQQPNQLQQSSAPPSHFMMQQAPNNMPQQMPNNMPQQMPNNMPATQQGGLGSFGMGFDQQAPPRFPQPGTPPSYGSVGGNPFG